MGKSLYDEFSIEVIESVLRAGGGRTDAVAALGIRYETFSQWMKRHPELNEIVRRAEIEGKGVNRKKCIDRILNDKSWQSAAWWLERTFPQEFTRQEKLNIDSDANVKILNIDPLKTNPEKDKKKNTTTDTKSDSDGFKDLL